MRNLLLRSLLIVATLTVVSSLLVVAAQNPLTAARDALRKAQEEARQKQQQAKPAPTTATPTPAKPAAAGTPAATATPAAAAAGAEQPWIPPADNSAAQVVVLDPSKLPDVVGVHLGMTAEQAYDIIHKQYPKDIFEKFPVDWWPAAVKPNTGYTVLSSEPGNSQDAHLSFTSFPNPQLLWRITRFTYRMHINHGTLLAALREKYGKESIAFADSDTRPATEDRRISDLFWLFDENGGGVPAPAAAALPSSTDVRECVGENPQPLMPTDDVDFAKGKFSKWCSSFVGVHIYISSQEIVENTITEMMDVPLAIRTAHAAAVWQRDLAEKLRQEDLEKSKKAKPVF